MKTAQPNRVSQHAKAIGLIFAGVYIIGGLTYLIAAL